MFGTISALAIVFIAVCMKDTHGLTDVEKKQLYFPKDDSNKTRSDSLSAESELETGSTSGNSTSDSFKKF